MLFLLQRPHTWSSQLTELYVHQHTADVIYLLGLVAINQMDMDVGEMSDSMAEF